uniref:Hemoglobin II n=1 Tax=Anadara broughtonii TaxID=148819 RepID=A0A223HH92_ANABR|nr:hemoglobin II [Anadara broughtonii]
MGVTEAIKAATDPEVVGDIRETWDKVSGDKKNGVALMIKLFDMEEKAIPFFKRMGDLSDPWNNRKLNGHGITLWYGLQNFVDQLDNANDLEDVARKFSVQHIARDVGSIEFGWIKDPLAEFLKDKLGDTCTDRHVRSWGKLIDVIRAVLAEG